MKFKKIKLKNIRSYDEQEVEFPDGAVLLSGDIGSGKTSILLAIEYALFGLQPGQTGSALLRNSTDCGEVSLEMEINGRQIIIERRLRRQAKSVTNEYASITIDGEKSESSITKRNRPMGFELTANARANQRAGRKKVIGFRKNCRVEIGNTKIFHPRIANPIYPLGNQGSPG